MNCYQEPCPDRRGPRRPQAECGPRPWEMPGCVPPAFAAGRIDVIAPVRPDANRAVCPAKPDEAAMMPQGSKIPVAAENAPAENNACDPSRFPIGMAYVPVQRWQQPYSLEAGFVRGTIFPALDLPFMMGGACR